MTPFEAGFVDGLRKLAFTQKLQYLPAQQEEQPPSWDECVEQAAKTYFGIEDPPPTNAYGVNTSKYGTKQRLTYNNTDPANAANKLKQKWQVPGVEPKTVGTGTKESPRLSVPGRNITSESAGGIYGLS